MFPALQALTAKFPRRPTIAAREMRDLLESDRAAFLEAAVKLIKGPGSEPSHQYLLTLLVTENLILERLANPVGLDFDDAAQIARCIQAGIDPSLAIKLLRLTLPTQAGAAAVTRLDRLLRVLEIVGAISDDSRTMPLLARLVGHPDMIVRSKVALLIGRINKNLCWVEARLNESDARVRANAVESIWGLDSPESRQVFASAIEDPDNRVAGNGALGLYRCGDLAAAEAMVQMLAHADPKFRSTAAWTMGESADPRFLGALTAGLSEPDTSVRQRIFSAIVKIRRRIQEIQFKARLQVVITRSEITGNARTLSLAVLGSGNHSVTQLNPPEVVIFEQNAVVHRINLQSRTKADHAAAAFALPRMLDLDGPFRRALAEGLGNFLRYKRNLDSWSALHYRAEPVTTGPVFEFRLDSALLRSGSGVASPTASAAVVAATARESIEFSTDPGAFIQSFESADPQAASCESQGEAAHRLVVALSKMRGSRCLFVFSSAATTTGWAEISDHAKLNRAAVYLIAMGHEIPDETAVLCRETGGDARVAASPDQLIAVCQRAAASLAGLYTVDYLLPACFNGRVKVQIYSEQGFGEDTFQASPEAARPPATVLSAPVDA
jgi:HEAT repeat protein